MLWASHTRKIHQHLYIFDYTLIAHWPCYHDHWHANCRISPFTWPSIMHYRFDDDFGINQKQINLMMLKPGANLNQYFFYLICSRYISSAQGECNAQASWTIRLHWFDLLWLVTVIIIYNKFEKFPLSQWKQMQMTPNNLYCSIY